MSRFHRFAASLVSGYVLLGANVLYTLASVPLALTYLTKAEFGLWALVTQVSGYVALVDFGLSASASRVLIDHKDNRASGSYGGMVQTGALVGLTQGLLVMLVGCGVALFLGPALHVEAALQREFTILLIGQCVLVGFSFVTRILSHMLTAHQRYDITNYTQASLFAVSFVVFWFCLARGQGVISVLWASASGTLIVVAANFYGCVRLGFLPRRGEWGRPGWPAFRELFNYGRDFFLYAAGCQLINASQVLILTRFLGLEAAAVWSICTRTYFVLTQLIYRIFDYSSGALAEMMVRGERELLLKRFRDLVQVSCALGMAAAVMLAACNSVFVGWWTSGRINSVELHPGDIKEPAALATRLAGAADPVSRFLWERFSAAGREVLAAAPGPEREDQVKATLAEELNGVIRGGLIFDAERFAAVRLSSTVAARLAQRESPPDVRRLNRWLLEEAYPAAIANSRNSAWHPFNDWLLGFWLIIGVVVHLHIGLVGQTKVFAFLRYLSFLEGAVFIAGSVVLVPWGGMLLLLALACLCNLAFHLPYGLFRTREYFRLSGAELARWHESIPRLAAWLLPVAVGVWWLAQRWEGLAGLTLAAGVLGSWSAFVILRFGLPATLKPELYQRVPPWARPALRRLGFESSARADGGHLDK